MNGSLPAQLARSAAPLLACIGITGASLAQSEGSFERLDADVEKQLSTEVRDHFTQPQLLTRRRQPVEPRRAPRFFEHLRIKAFEGSDDGDLALGFEYDFAKSIAVSKESNGALDFIADGNVAFDRDENPNDFLWTSLRARWLGSPVFGSSSHDLRQQLAAETPGPTREHIEKFNTQARQLSESGASREAILESQAFQELRRDHLAALQRTLSPELVWDFDLHAGLESTQDFSSRQWVFGPSISGRLLSWNPDTRLSRLNVFDFPGAALRWFTGQDEGFRPSGLAYPTVRVGLDMVDASDDDVRSAVTTDDSLLRARFEAGLETHVLDVKDESLYLTASWCGYQEIDAASDVKAADYDGSSYFELRMDLPSHWSLTYSAGRLPLDTSGDSTFGLGYEVAF